MTPFTHFPLQTRPTQVKDPDQQLAKRLRPGRITMIYFRQIITVTVGIDLYSAVQVDRASSPADQPFPAPRA
jgi:hypothetical protein